MIESLPAYVPWIFGLTTALTVAIYLYGVWEVSQRKVFTFLTASVLAVLLGLHATLAFSGFYLVNTIPPRFPLAPL